MVLKIGIAGGLGRMGTLLTQEVLNASGEVILSCIGARDADRLHHQLPRGCQASLTESPRELVEQSDVVIDFTAPELSLRHAYYAATLGKKIVIGTTGFSPEQSQKIEEAAQSAALLVAANMSLGIATLGCLLPLIKKALGESFDIEIQDTHHRHKKDAPSGTALTLAKKLSGEETPSLVDHQNKPYSPRNSKDIGISVSRAGGVFGDHAVSFISENEMLTLSHRALDRRLFATGALKAALWLSNQSPGLYSMDDVL